MYRVAIVLGLALAVPVQAGGRGASGLPGAAVAPNVGFLQSQLRATDEEWTVLEPILQRLAAGVEILDAADAGTLATTNVSRPPMGGMSNDSFDGPSNIAAGEFGGFGGARRGSTGPAATGPINLPAATAPGADGPSSSDTLTLAQALADLKTALANRAADGVLKERLAVVRDARAKTKLEVELASRELVPILTVDQEAVLVALGYLR